MGIKAVLNKSAAAVAALSLVLAGCGGGGGSDNDVGGSPSPLPSPSPSPSPGSGRLFTAPAQESLSIADVQQVIAQAVGEAQARNLPVAVAVVDRVGNVLAVFRMNGTRPTFRTSDFISFNGTRNDPDIDLQGVLSPAGEEILPTEAGAITKAITGAYLSSSGNAFSTRTASEIVQQHFPPSPTTVGFESGPLFGVQFSSLPCSDLVARFNPAGGSTFASQATGAAVTSPGLIGPKRSPLGLAADAGGFPLYKNGVVVGGVGVMGDGDYGFDPDRSNFDNDPEEFIALAAIQGFAPPDDILADRISVDGTLLKFSDARIGGLSPRRTDFAAINGSAGQLVAVRGYTAGAIIEGVPYGTEQSGIRYAASGEFNSPDVFVLTDGAGNNRFPVRGATDAPAGAAPLTAAEVRALLEEGFGVMAAGRAQIRRPLNSRIQVTLSVVDTSGANLGVIRSPDAPIFGTDVALQKARSVNFFSHPSAGADLSANPDGDVAAFVERFRSFLGDAAALTGTVAYSNRAIGNLARPYYPDGEVGRPPGPLSRPIEDFNPFAVGLQVQLIIPNLLQHVGFVLGGATDTPLQCTNLPGPNRLRNGLQIFAGGVPVYRNGVLVGGLGISGDGIDQDDMISFLGVHRAGQRVGTGINLPPPSIRSDRVLPPRTNGTRYRFVNCPFRPFLDETGQNACERL